jgi:anti-anti-sigma factor
MKRHLTASAGSGHTRNESGKVAAAKRTRLTLAANARKQPGRKLASVRPRTHTLILTGELNHRTAHGLEEAIDRLCEEGVTGITLDLRQLSHIDPTGVAVIAFRYRLCKRRGYDFMLIPGPRSLDRAFERAGVADVLPFQQDAPDQERTVERFSRGGREAGA